MPALRQSRHLIIRDEAPSPIMPMEYVVCIPAAENFTLRLQKTPFIQGVHRGAQNLVYPAAIELTDQLLKRHTPFLKKGARVIELGCGLGLPGMVCGALGSHVLLTDVLSVIPFIEQRIALNFPSRNASTSGSVRAAALQWDRASARKLAAWEGGFDLVLSSDGIYAPLYGQESSESLAEVIRCLCGPSTVAMIAVHHRPEEGAQSDGTEEFLEALRRHLEVTLLEVDRAGHSSHTLRVIEARLPKTCAAGCRKRSVSGDESDQQQSKAARVEDS